MGLSDKVDETERLYRVIKRSRPDCITASGKVSPALFKDNKGISVDRDGGRPEGVVIDFVLTETFKQRAKAIGMVYSSFCLNVGACVIPSPNKTNPFHADIWLNRDDERVRNVQALRIADNCRIVYKNDDIEWIYA